MRETIPRKHDGRKGDWIQTYTGIQFWPLDPRPEEIHIEDIAHALSHQCRFAGHCEQFYSVADHCVRVSEIVPFEYAMWGLLHDAAEAYLVDLPRPIKKYSRMGTLYAEIEAALMLAVGVRFNLHGFEPAIVKRADNVLLVTEKRDLVKCPPKPWEDNGCEPLPARIIPRTSSEAKSAFLFTYESLMRTGTLRK